MAKSPTPKAFFLTHRFLTHPLHCRLRNNKSFYALRRKTPTMQTGKRHVVLTALLVLQLSEARSLQSISTPRHHSQQLSSTQSNYDNTYADSSYVHDATLISQNGRGDLSHYYSKIPRENDRQIKLIHEIVDNKHNFDYTYGDPEVDYDYDGLTSEADSEEERREDSGSDDGGSDEVDISKESDEGEHKAGKRIVASIIEWMIRNWQRTKRLRDQWQETKDGLKKSWTQIKDSMKRIKDTLARILDKFGKEVEEGLKYCYFKVDLRDQTIEIHGFETIEKLERLLEQGNKIVAALFKFIGQKIQQISNQSQREATNVASGGERKSDNIVDRNTYYGSEDEENAISDIGSINLFEDSEVLEKLKLLVEENILSQVEVESIKRAAAEQTMRSRGPMIL